MEQVRKVRLPILEKDVLSYVRLRANMEKYRKLCKCSIFYRKRNQRRYERYYVAYIKKMDYILNKYYLIHNSPSAPPMELHNFGSPS